MRSRCRRTAGAMAAVVTAALVGACGGTAGDAAPGPADGGEPQRGGTLVYAFNSDVQSLDPTRCGQNLNWGACEALYGVLLGYDQDKKEFTPAMAESFTSDDGRVWTLKLRDGVTFSDGTAFDAAAVVYNWDRAKDPANLSVAGSIVEKMTYEAADPRTVTVTLDQVNWQVPWLMYSELAFIGSPAALQQKGKDFANSPVGAGPFTFENWARGTRMSLVRNLGYWDQPRPYLDRLEFAVIGSDDQRLNALRAGEITVMATLTDEYAERATGEGFVDHVLSSLSGVGIRMGERSGEPTADPDVRMAVAKLIDAKQIIDAFYPGTPVPATFAREGSPFYDPTATFPEQDVAGAQKLIDDYRARTGGAEVVLHYKLVAGIPLQSQVAQMLQAQVQRVNGLRMEIIPLDAAAYQNDANNGDYEISLAGINGINPDILYEQFHTGASQNTAGYSDPEADAALERARTSKEPAEQTAAYMDAMRRIAATAGHRSWRYQEAHLVAEDTVHGIVPSYAQYLRSDQVWMEQS